MTPEYLGWRDRLGAALDQRFYTVEWLDWLVSDDRAFFLAGERAAIVAEIRCYPTGARAIHGICAAGDVSEIVSLLIPAAEAWGKSQGCRHGFVDSREGWQRLLKSSGYDTYKVSVRKDI